MNRLVFNASVMVLVFVLSFGFVLLSAPGIGASGPNNSPDGECEEFPHPVIASVFPTEMCFIDGEWGLWVTYCDGAVKDGDLILEWCWCKEVCVVNFKFGLKTKIEPPH